MMKVATFATMVMFLMTAVPLAHGEKLLVQKDGEYSPALAISWQQDNTQVILKIKKDEDASLIAEQLKNKLPDAKVNLQDEHTIVIKNIEDGLKTLAGIEIELDPLAALGGLSGGIAMAGPEAGGSIRVSKQLTLSATVFPTSVFKQHSPKERFIASVKSVETGDFPVVVLKLKIKRKARKSDIKLKRYKTYKAMVLLSGKEQAPDFSDKHNQQNLSAFYLLEGDRIEGHVLKKVKDTIYLDYIKRIR